MSGGPLYLHASRIPLEQLDEFVEKAITHIEQWSEPDQTLLNAHGVNTIEEMHTQFAALTGKA
jgi:hypothetical protein